MREKMSNQNDPLGLLGYFLWWFAPPPLFWRWEGSNYPSQSRNGPYGPKGPKVKIIYISIKIRRDRMDHMAEKVIDNYY